MSEFRINRKSKDTVFGDLFTRPEYLLELYRSLHPEDRDATEEMLQDVTIRNVLADRIYNDLGFTVRGKLMILVEAQSTWTVNIVVRALLYLAQSYKEHLESIRANMYGTKPVAIPEPELYVIYTGSRKERREILSLSEDFFGGKQTALEVRVKVLYGEDRGSIIGQYVRFCKVFTEQMKKHERPEDAIREVLRICRDENILREYLKEHEREAISAMMTLFDDEYIRQVFAEEKLAEGRAEGRAEGMAEERRNMIWRLRNRNFTDTEIAEMLDYSVAEIAAL